MDWKKWADKKVKKLDSCDIKLIKLAVFAFALMVAKLWPVILGLDWYWYALIFVLAAIRPYKNIFSK